MIAEGAEERDGARDRYRVAVTLGDAAETPAGLVTAADVWDGLTGLVADGNDPDARLEASRRGVDAGHLAGTDEGRGLSPV